MNFSKASLVNLFLFSCQTSYEISTTPPGAKIFQKDLSLGETPVKIEGKNLTKEASGGAWMEIKKPGFRPLVLWLPLHGRNQKIQINLKPFSENISEKVLPDPQKVQSLIDQLLKLQSAYLTKESLSEEESSPNTLSKLLKDYPKLSSLHILKSFLMIRLQDTQGAQEALKPAILYDEIWDPDIQSLLQELKTQDAKSPQKG